MVKLIAAFAAGALVAILVAVAILFFADLKVVDDAGGSGDTVTVPSVVGDSPTHGSAQVEALGLGISDDGCTDTDLPGWVDAEDMIIASQVPDAGTEAPATATVTLFCD